MMLTKPLFPSPHAYSNIGPWTALRGTIADQGFVHVVGSSIVNLYSIVAASRRVKRSVIFKVLALAPWKVAPGRKLVVSTTSVLPSQWPRESPCHRRMFCERCGRPSNGMMRTSLFHSYSTMTYPGPCTMGTLMSQAPGSMGGPPNDRQRTPNPKSAGTSAFTTPPFSRSAPRGGAVFLMTSCCFAASGVKGGILPSGGSTTNDDRRFGLTPFCHAPNAYTVAS